MQVVLTEDEYNKLKEKADFFDRADPREIVWEIAKRIEKEHRYSGNNNYEHTLKTKSLREVDITSGYIPHDVHYEITIKRVVEDKSE